MVKLTVMLSLATAEPLAPEPSWKRSAGARMRDTESTTPPPLPLSLPSRSVRRRRCTWPAAGDGLAPAVLTLLSAGTATDTPVAVLLMEVTRTRLQYCLCKRCGIAAG